jgi:hypothetical protein
MTSKLKLQKEPGKTFSKRRQEERDRKKENSFSEIGKYAHCHFLENTNFLSPFSFLSI